MTQEAAAANNVPANKTELFWEFTLLALQGFGGVLTIAQQVFIDKKKWLTKREFLELWAAAQILPGPNIVNLSVMYGDRHFGFAGAMVGMAGMLLFPMLVVIALTVGLYSLLEPTTLNNLLRGMGITSAGMLLGAGMKLGGALKQNRIGIWASLVIAALAFIAVALLRLKLAYVLLGLGGCAWAYAAFVLAKQAQTTEGEK